MSKYDYGKMIDTLDLQVSVIFAFRWRDINTVGDLMSKTSKELMLI